MYMRKSTKYIPDMNIQNTPSTMLGNLLLTYGYIRTLYWVYPGHDITWRRHFWYSSFANKCARLLTALSHTKNVNLVSESKLCRRRRYLKHLKNVLESPKCKVIRKIVRKSIRLYPTATEFVYFIVSLCILDSLACTCLFHTAI